MLPDNSAIRKTLPVTEGVLKYFPLAIAYVALVSKVGNDKHNPGEPLHWSRGKSDDHLDCVGRHLLETGKYDGAGLLHDGMLAWRALANLQIVLEGYQAVGYDIFTAFGGHPVMGAVTNPPAVSIPLHKLEAAMDAAVQEYANAAVNQDTPGNGSRPASSGEGFTKG